MEITFKLKDSAYVSLFKEVYEKYAICCGRKIIGYKYVSKEKDVVYGEIRCPKYMRKMIISALPYSIGNAISTEKGVEFSTDKKDTMDFLNNIVELMEKAQANHSLVKTSLECIECYSYRGDGNIDCEIYASPFTANDPYCIVNNANKTVSPCHGYCSSAGADIAKKLGYKWMGIK